ncbi:hypothetical protein ACP4OV_011629 [Aristida adscensionis]
MSVLVSYLEKTVDRMSQHSGVRTHSNRKTQGLTHENKQCYGASEAEPRTFLKDPALLAHAALQAGA